MEDLKRILAEQDRQIAAVHAAEEKYEADGDREALIKFWEGIWDSGGLLFNGSKWTFRLPDLYFEDSRYDDAMRILEEIDNPAYQDRKQAYIKKIAKRRRES